MSYFTQPFNDIEPFNIIEDFLTTIGEVNHFLDNKFVLPMGTLISNGNYTAVIELNPEHVPDYIKLDNPVLIVSIEQNKFLLMKELYPDKVIDIDIEVDSTLDFKLWNTQFKVYSFFMEKGSSVNNPEITLACSIFSDFFEGSDFNVCSPYDFLDITFMEHVSIDSIEKTIISSCSHKSDSSLVYKYLSVIERDIFKIATLLCQSDSGALDLDIHNEQFLDIDGEVCLIDPFIM